MGMAQAKAVVFFIIVAGISLLQVRSTKRREVEY
jgi:ABC-type sugar transport system permease subunit